MVKVNFYDFNSIPSDKLKFAVITARYKGQWVFVRHKDRNTWEIPGGHHEENEEISQTASRELFEETGAQAFTLTPICVYSVCTGDSDISYTESFGGLFLADIASLDSIPPFEIAEIRFSNSLPENLTYPDIQPFLHRKVLSIIDSPEE